jgi:hypothetical protein
MTVDALHTPPQGWLLTGIASFANRCGPMAGRGPAMTGVAESRDGTLLDSNPFPRCMGRSPPAMPFAVSLDPLLADLCRLLWREPRPFRAACTDCHPDRLACDDPLLDGIAADCIEHLVSPNFVWICQTACLVGQPEDGTLTILV